MGPLPRRRGRLSEISLCAFDKNYHCVTGEDWCELYYVFKMIGHQSDSLVVLARHHC